MTTITTDDVNRHLRFSRPAVWTDERIDLMLMLGGLNSELSVQAVASEGFAVDVAAPALVQSSSTIIAQMTT